MSEPCEVGDGLRTSALRGGAIGLLGAVCTALGGFLLVFVAARALGPADTGRLFAAIALFTVVTNAAKFGADTSLVRFVAHLVSRRREGEIPLLVRIATFPTLVGSCLVAVTLFIFAGTVANLLYADIPLSAGVADVRELAWFVPPATLTLVLLAVTRGLGSVAVFVMVEQVFKPLGRPLLLVVVFLLGGGPRLILGAWLAPVVIGLVLAMGSLRSQLRPRRPDPQGERTVSARDFWGFAAPRALSGFLEIVAPWVAVLLLSGLSGSVDAAIFTSVSRIAIAGTMVMIAMRLALAPHLSAAFSARDLRRVTDLHQHSTVLMILMSWPFFVLVAVFPGPVLAIFGEQFPSGSWALVAVATANMLNVAVGNVQTLILMGGRSSWNLLGTGLAVLTQICLGVLLIPAWGVTGAGVAYAAGVLVNNITATLQVRFGLHIQVWASSGTAACVLTVGTFGVLSVGCRVFGVDTLVAMLSTALLGLAICIVILFRRPELFGVREGWRVLHSVGRGSSFVREET